MRRTAVSIISIVALGSLSLVGGSPARADVTPSVTSPTVHTIAEGYNFSLMIGPDGNVYGTGENDAGQLTGSGARTTLTEVTGLPAGVTATSVTVGSNFSLVLGSDGSVYGAGSDADGELAGLGQKTVLTPLPLPAGVRATDVAAGTQHTLVVGSDGKVYGTGNNDTGQVTGVAAGVTGPNVTTFTELPGLPDGVQAVAVAGGFTHSLVLGSDGIVYGLGTSNAGQLTGTDDMTTLTPLTGLPAGVHATAIAAGKYFSVVLGSDGNAYGTGANSYGQLTGTGTKTTLTLLTGLPDGVHATAIAAAALPGLHVLVLGSDGTVYGAGLNNQGQLTGTGNKSSLTALTELPTGVTATDISAGGNQTMIRGSDGLVYGVGQAGGGLTTSVTTNGPITVLAYQVDSTTLPTIVGTARYGDTLSTTRSDWSETDLTPAPTRIERQWLTNGAPVDDAIAKTFLVPISVIDTQLSFRETGTAAGAVPDVVTSANSAPVLKAGAPVWTAPGKPVISGTFKVGKALKVANLNLTGFDPDATSLSYQWVRNGRTVVGTRATYKVVKADSGARISVRITAHRPGCLDGGLSTAAVRIAR